MKPISRRQIVTGAALAAAAALALRPRLGIAAGLPPAAQPSLRRWLACAPASLAGRRVGHRCLELSAASADAELLIGELRADLRARGLYRGEAEIDQLRQSLAELRRADFRAGDVVRVDGWILSRNEVRLYALAALAA